MKLIFLDVDGVLNYDALFHERHHAWTTGMSARERLREQVVPELCARLRRLVDEAGGGTGSLWVVVSSSWRSTPGALEVLTGRLFEERIPVHDVTPEYEDALRSLGWPHKMSLYYLRGTEIHAYLETWRARMWHVGPVTHCVVLDDHPVVGPREELCGAGYLAKHVVKVDSRVGLTDENVVAALAILNDPQLTLHNRAEALGEDADDEE